MYARVSKCSTRYSQRNIHKRSCVCVNKVSGTASHEGLSWIVSRVPLFVWHRVRLRFRGWEVRRYRQTSKEVSCTLEYTVLPLTCLSFLVSMQKVHTAQFSLDFHEIYLNCRRIYPPVAVSLGQNTIYIRASETQKERLLSEGDERSSFFTEKTHFFDYAKLKLL